MVQEVKVQISVLVIVKKHGMCGEANKINPVITCLFAESQVTIVDVQFILTGDAFVITNLANIDIQ